MCWAAAIWSGLAVCGAYLALVLSSALGVPVWWTLPLLLPLAFGAGMLLHLSVLGRALRGATWRRSS